MSNEETEVQHTQQAFLVVWGWLAEQIGLVEQLERVTLKQKRYHHKPQTKILEFLVAILAGLKYIQDISREAHPLDQDQAVAVAWGQPGWADYSGVSRTLRQVSWVEARQIASVLDQVSQPFLDAEVKRLREQGQRLRLDGDLTGLPVSNTSQTYPNAAFGHMDADIRLGYQAGVVSLNSPTYGRLWLSIAHHPGNTVSCSQAEALVLAGKARLGRRTDLLRQRLHAFEPQVALTRQRQELQVQAVQQAKGRLTEAEQQQQARQQYLAELEQAYQVRQRRERPTSQLAQARQRLYTSDRRCHSRQQTWQAAQRRLDKTTVRLQQQLGELNSLYQRLHRFEQENRANPQPLEVEFCLDAGFGTYQNVALLIEMGYEVYTKPHSHHVVAFLKRQIDAQTTWTRVGANAELVAWPKR